MKRRATDDFLVETVGHCFICMEDASSNVSSEKLEAGSTPSHSLLYLSRYLKIKIRKVFKEEAPIPEYLLKQVDKSILKVTLCEECASWNRKLSRLFRQLEKIEIEAASYLQLIQEKVARADQDQKSGLISKFKVHGSTSDLLGKLEVSEVLRNETMQRCSQKLSWIQPNVRIQKLSDEEIQLAKPLKVNSNFRLSTTTTIGSASEAGLNDASLETLNLNSSSDQSEDGYLDDIEEPSEGTLQAGSSLQIKNDTGSRGLKDPIKYVKNVISGGWKCDLCSKEFRSYASIHAHYQSVHLKVRYMCKVCKKVFTRKDHLTVHQKSVHLKQRFDCQFCSKSFSSAANRRHHIRNNRCTKRTDSNDVTIMQQDYSPPDKDEDSLDTGIENKIKEEHT